MGILPFYIYTLAIIVVAAFIVALVTLLRLRCRVRRLREHSQFKIRLANELAHEIRNPISSIVSALDTFYYLTKGKLEENEIHILGAVKEYSYLVLSQINDYLDISRVEDGTIKLVPVPVSIKVVCSGVIGILESLALRKSITFDLFVNDIKIGREEGGNEDLTVWCDEKKLKQIIFNFLHNAIKFSPVQSFIQIRCSLIGDEVWIGIVDKGSGIDIESIRRILSREVIIRDHTGDGLGLGMSISHSLITLAGGQLVVIANGKETYVDKKHKTLPKELAALYIDNQATANLSTQNLSKKNLGTTILFSLPRYLEPS